MADSFVLYLNEAKQVVEVNRILHELGSKAEEFELAEAETDIIGVS